MVQVSARARQSDKVDPGENCLQQLGVGQVLQIERVEQVRACQIGVMKLRHVPRHWIEGKCLAAIARLARDDRGEIEIYGRNGWINRSRGWRSSAGLIQPWQSGLTACRSESSHHQLLAAISQQVGPQVRIVEYPSQ